MPGPRPKSTSIKRLEGNPGKRKLGNREPNPGPSKDEVPSWLPEEGKRYWSALHPLLERLKVVTEADETALIALCVTYARWREAQAFLQEHGTGYKTVSTAGNVVWKRFPQVQIFSDMGKQLQGWLIEFGLTPYPRSKVEMVTEKGHDWFDEFLAQR